MGNTETEKYDKLYHSVIDQGSWPNQQKLIRSQTKNSGKALLGPLLQQGEQKQVTGSLPRSLRVVRVRVVQGSGRGVAQVVCLSPWWCYVGFWSFCILFIICPNCTCTQLFLVLCSFFVFCCSRRPRCKHCSKGTWFPGPGLSQQGCNQKNPDCGELQEKKNLVSSI